MKKIKIDYVKKLTPLFTKRKRVKIAVGGRGSTKSTGVGDYVLARVSSGELWCCAREFQNSIDESVHRSLSDEIERLGLTGFTISKTEITHVSGGRIFYKGLSRNITSLKSTLSGIDGLWIEEGEDLSANTLKVLTASVRLNAEETERLLDGRKVSNLDELKEILKDSDIKMPEIFITMNRGSRADPISKKYLERAEADLTKNGIYEDEELLVVEVNYTDMPKSWFIASGLEVERQSDYEKMSRAEYNHKWLGQYLDTVDGAIIKQEWFDACVDAHKKPNLVKMFEPRGLSVCAHDPSDGGDDTKGLAVRHGSIIKMVREKDSGEIDEGFDWASGICNENKFDWFVWDGDGMGAGLKRQASIAFDGTKVQYKIFQGSLSGSGMDDADKQFISDANTQGKEKKLYKDVYFNNRARYYKELADRMYNTYRVVVKGEYCDPEDMISFDSDGIENIKALGAELCRIPRKPNSSGLFQILSKKEMKSLGIKSPNLADSVMMTLIKPIVKQKRKPLRKKKVSIA